jgi:hypothetical protein
MGDEPLATDLESSEGKASAAGGSGTDARTRELPAVAAAVSEDRCGNCGAPLAHDQRYCVECGERRGQSRFPETQQAAPPVQSRRARAKGAPRSPRASAGTTLVAGVGVLLLAIGLGVLIGRIGNNSGNPKSAPPAAQVITVQGAGAGAGAGAGGGAGGGTSTGTATTHTKTSAASSTPKGLGGKLKKAAAQTAPPSAAVQKKANEAAGKVLGNSKKLAAPTATQGGSCSGGAGCQGGKFTGNFFGN